MVGAVVMGGAEVEGLTDSKKLTKKRREALEPLIYQRAKAVGLGWVSASELDEIGMSEALKLATIRAISEISCSYTEIIIDGTMNFLKETGKGQYVTTMPKADLLVPSVSAASVVAKVARDRYMAEVGGEYPMYGFASHAGYGVAKHRAAIEEYGVMSEHRLSFAPLRKYRFADEARAVKVSPTDTKLRQQSTTRAIGDAGEDAATTELERRGHAVMQRNWKTKYCEIDIISKKDDTIYFTEVKYRKTNNQGDGLAAITPQKLRQMRYAADAYVHIQRLQGYSLQLLAAAVTGTPPKVVDIVAVDT